MRIRLYLAIALALLTVSVNAQTVVCEERSYPEITLCYDGDALIPDCSGAEDDDFVYFDNDPCQLQGCVLSFWVYQESNGYPGLQRKDVPSRDDDAPHAPWLKDDTCDGLIQPDTILF